MLLKTESPSVRHLSATSFASFCECRISSWEHSFIVARHFVLCHVMASLLVCSYWLTVKPVILVLCFTGICVVVLEAIVSDNNYKQPVSFFNRNLVSRWELRVAKGRWSVLQHDPRVELIRRIKGAVSPIVPSALICSSRHFTFHKKYVCFE